MHIRSQYPMTLCILFLLFGDIFASDFGWDDPTELDYYVHYDDGFFEYSELVHYELEDMDLYMLNMTSQKWMDESFSSASVWYHEMAIAIPHVIDFDDAAAFGIVARDNEPDYEPAAPDDIYNVILRWLVNQTNTIAGYIKQVPNQPVVFQNDPEQGQQREDDFIAWTWLEADAVNYSQPEMIARFPMTKAAKRGLDTVNRFVLEKTGNNITRFHVGGASKRGWTSWSLAMTDKRVISISPLVYSLLNFPDTLMHHYRAMNEAWSWAMSSFWYTNITCFLLTPEASTLYDYEDPYNYRSRLTIPKLMISATGDEYFFPSDSHHWWAEMPGQNWLMMIQNTDHFLQPFWLRLANNVVAFWKAVLNGYEIPAVSWNRTQEAGVGGLVRLTTSRPPIRQVAFYAETLDNVTRRDFRLTAGPPDDKHEQDVQWYRDDVTVLDEVTFEHSHNEMEDKWTGHFILVEFEGEEGFNYEFTSEVNVLPDSFPAEPCEVEIPYACCGVLT